MKTLLGLTLTAAAGVLAMNAFADSVTLPDAAAHAASVAARQVKMAKINAATKSALQVKNAQSRAAASGVKAMGTNTYPGSPTPNPVRAYPPSCAAPFLPDASSGPPDRVYSTRMPLYARDGAGNPQNPETVTVTLWRIACSSGGSATPYNETGEFYNAMTLIRIDRDAANEGVGTAFPTFPALYAGQGGNLTNPQVEVRTAVEPNTLLEDEYDTPVIYSSTFVLENYHVLDQNGDINQTFNIQYSDAFSLLIDPTLSTTGEGAALFQVAAYSPTTSTYPAAFADLPIDGYMSTSWYDPNHDGEGMTVQVYDNGPSDTSHRTFAAFWYTFDSTGRPYWLVAQGTIAVGATSFQANAYYAGGGGFAGSAGDADLSAWGTVTFSFPDCNTMNFSFDGSTDGATAGPGGSGSRTWSRVANENGLSCE